MMNCTFYILYIIYTKADNAAKANILKCIHYIAYHYIYTLPKVLGHPLLMKTLTLVISMKHTSTQFPRISLYA